MPVSHILWSHLWLGIAEDAFARAVSRIAVQGAVQTMLRIEQHELGPRLFVGGRRLHECHAGLVLVLAALAGALTGGWPWPPLLSLMASISLNLGLLNLLPIPVLDGGHIFIMALEGLVRRDFSMRVKEKMFLAGFAVLLMLMVTVIYNDLTRIALFEKLMPWR